MNKSNTILDLISYLQNEFGEDAIVIADHWTDDPMAVGITNKTQKELAYLSIYSENENSYYLALENPPTNDDFPYTPAGEFDNLTLREVEEKIAEHLKISKKC